MPDPSRPRYTPPSTSLPHPHSEESISIAPLSRGKMKAVECPACDMHDAAELPDVVLGVGEIGWTRTLDAGLKGVRKDREGQERDRRVRQEISRLLTKGNDKIVTMSGFKSIASLGSALNVERQSLRKYSWLPDVLRVDGSVIGRIIGPVLTVTIFSTGIAAANEIYGYQLNLNNNVLPLLSVVVGLILVFRNGTSYDRYYEGRKDFGSLTSTVRNLSRLIWIHANAPTPPPPKEDPYHLNIGSPISSTISGPHPAPAIKLRADKVRLIKLLLSYVYAVVHHLRNEPGTDYEDYEGVLPDGFEYFDSIAGLDQNTVMNRYATYSALGGGIGAQVVIGGRRPSTTGSRRPSFQLDRPNGQRRDGGEAIVVPDATTPLIGGDAIAHTEVQFRARSSVEAFLPLPLAIAHEITQILYDMKKKGYIEIGGPAGFNTLNTMVNGMVDQLTNLERVATTPIPTSYGIHLKQ
ncbi:hypothetical protein FRB99_003217, partial [Tulasnella sp. 403]